jgi:hypothetical protein
MLSHPLLRLRRQRQLRSWRHWTWHDYVRFFLSKSAAHARLKGDVSPARLMSADELHAFCSPIRERISRLFANTATPRLSILVPAYNEEHEILATLVSYTLLDIREGTAEIVIANNNSTDATALLLAACGVRPLACEIAGVGYARAAALQAAASTSEYLWMTDADTRVIPPLRKFNGEFPRASLLSTCLAYLDSNPHVSGASTGACLEAGAPLWTLARNISVRIGRSRGYSVWWGCNQFFRRSAFEAAGGVDQRVQRGDDHDRHARLVRYSKANGYQVHSASTHPELYDPVYYGGRRFASLARVISQKLNERRQTSLPRDEHGVPIPGRDLDWNIVRN